VNRAPQVGLLLRGAGTDKKEKIPGNNILKYKCELDNSGFGGRIENRSVSERESNPHRRFGV
jgi:hypothetical protein